MEEEEEAYGDDLLRQLRRRTNFRWISEEPWRDTLLPSRDVARFLDENSFLPRKRGSGGSGGRERAKTGNSFIYTRCVLFQTGLSLPPERFFLSLMRETELIFDEGEEGREL